MFLAIRYISKRLIKYFNEIFNTKIESLEIYIYIKKENTS